jgi:hypothetical protein
MIFWWITNCPIQVYGILFFSYKIIKDKVIRCKFKPIGFKVQVVGFHI